MNYILSRVHKINEFVVKSVQFLSQAKGFETVLLADERSGDIGAIPGIRKISITNDRLAEFAVEGCNNVLWACGDYGLYFARQDLPPAEYYWLIESDVYMNFEKASDFFEKFEACKADFITSYLTKSQKHWRWYWHASMEPFALDVYKCFFPVIRISGAAIDMLHQARLEMVSKYKEMRNQGHLELWPNDEVFVASTLACSSRQCVDMNEVVSGVWQATNFNTIPPHSRKYVENLAINEKLFHPVLEGDTFRKRLLYILNSPDADWALRDNLLEHVEAEMELECGSEAAAEVRARMQVLRECKPPSAA